MYSESELRSARRRKRAAIGLVLAVLVLIAAGYAYYYYTSFFEQAASAQLETGAIALKAGTGGKVARVLVSEGQRVKAGALLVQLDPAEKQRAFEARKGELEHGERQLKGAYATLARMRETLESGDEAAQKRYDDARAWTARLQAKVQERRAALAQARSELDATEIRAPADGHIGGRKVAEGKTVLAGAPVVTFVGASDATVEATFRRPQLEKIRVGQRAKVSVPGLDRDLEGQVASIGLEPGAQIAPRSGLERFLSLFFPGGGALVPVRIALDRDSVGKDSNRLVDDASVQAKVYIE